MEINVTLTIKDHLLCAWHRYILTPIRKIVLLIILVDAGIFYITHNGLPIFISIFLVLMVALFLAERLLRPALLIRWWISNVLFVVFVVIPIIAIAVVLGFYQTPSPDLWVLLAFSILIGLPIFKLWLIREGLRKNPEALKPCTVRILPEGLLVKSSQSETKFNWVMVNALDEDFNSFYLRQKDQTKIVLPKRGFGDGESVDKGRELLKSYIQGTNK